MRSRNGNLGSLACSNTQNRVGFRPDATSLAGRRLARLRLGLRSSGRVLGLEQAALSSSTTLVDDQSEHRTEETLAHLGVNGKRLYCGLSGARWSTWRKLSHFSV